MGVIILIVLLLIIKLVWKPRVDVTAKGKILLWYGSKHRKYIELN